VGRSGWAWLLAIAAAFTVELVVLARPAAEASFSPRQERKMHRAVKLWKQENHYPGLEAGLWQRGVGSFRAKFGFAKRHSHRRLRFADHFQVGSITKTFTATLVLQLVERGSFAWTTP
jgi:CubicO group peptidase (beta-lactamase class C family)